MSDIAIHVENISKQYRLGAYQNNRNFRETLKGAFMAPIRRAGRLLRGQISGETELGETIWALKDISCKIKQGEIVGCIGRNGSGKSTLLKILSRITEPTTGYVEIRGRIGSLLEVGTGFHSELSGRENIYLNGSILGMKKAEIRKKFDEIVAFSEVERFIDTPVKHYSSGMYLRLAFAVAANLEPEILLVDEVLAVGDMAFQNKCLGKMGEVASEGRTVLLVSHNMSAILRLCRDAILLDQGKIIFCGNSSEVVKRYLGSGNQAGAEKKWLAEELPNTCGPFRPIALRVCNGNGRVTDLVNSSQSFTIEMEYDILQPVRNLALLIKLYSNLEELLFISSDVDDPARMGQYPTRPAGHYISRCHIPANLLNSGSFLLGVSASVPNVCRYFWEQRSIRFNVEETGGVGTQWVGGRGGFFRPALEWDIDVL
jgi:lipopolysaccharide transport system ATP-binding protein